MHRHFLDHTQQQQTAPNAAAAGADVNFMAASTAAAAAAAAAANRLSDTMDNMNSNAGNAANGGIPNFQKIKKSTDDYDKFVDIVKNIVDSHKSTPDKIDTFGDFIKSYMKRWPGKYLYFKN